MTAPNHPQGRVRVLLIGDPPAVDKVGRVLGEHAEVEVIRNPHLKQVVVRSGFDWVLGMNLQRKGALIKEAARASGARFLTIPPNWSGAQSALRDDGFFTEVERHRGAPLGHRPFAGIADRVPATSATEPAAGTAPRAVWVCGAGHAFDHAQPDGCPTCAAARAAGTAPVSFDAETAALTDREKKVAEPAPRPVPKPARPERTSGLFTSPSGRTSTLEERETTMRTYVRDHPKATHDQIQAHLRGLFGLTIDSNKIRQARRDLTDYQPTNTREQVRTRKLLVWQILLADVNAAYTAVSAQVKAKTGTGVSDEIIRRQRGVILRARAWAAAHQPPPPAPTPAPAPAPAPTPEPPAAPPPAPDVAPAPPAPVPAAGGTGLTDDERAVLDLVKDTLSRANPPYARFSITLREDGRLDVDLARRVVVEHKVTY